MNSEISVLVGYSCVLWGCWLLACWVHEYVIFTMMVACINICQLFTMVACTTTRASTCLQGMTSAATMMVACTTRASTCQHEYVILTLKYEMEVIILRQILCKNDYLKYGCLPPYGLVAQQLLSSRTLSFCFRILVKSARSVIRFAGQPEGKSLWLICTIMC